MIGNAIDFINDYIAKKSDDELYIDFRTNYKGDLWDVEYEDEDEDEEDFDSIKVQKSKMNYVFYLKLQAMNYKVHSKTVIVCITKEIIIDCKLINSIF